MVKKIIFDPEQWDKEANRFKYCEALEEGDILYFPSIPFSFPADEREILISENPDRPDGKFKEALQHYSKQAVEFFSLLLAPYAKHWKFGVPFFKVSLEEEEPLYLEAASKRPLHGGRVLRFFTNIHKTESCGWITSDGFVELLKKYVKNVPIPNSVGYSLKSRLERKMKQWLKMPLRSPYDQFMLKMRAFLKTNLDFQKNAFKERWDFPPGSCWAAFTDQIAHAAASGRQALEQSFFIPQKALLRPEKSPASLLERLSGRNLVDPEFLKEVFSSD